MELGWGPPRVHESSSSTATVLTAVKIAVNKFLDGNEKFKSKSLVHVDLCILTVACVVHVGMDVELKEKCRFV